MYTSCHNTLVLKVDPPIYPFFVASPLPKNRNEAPNFLILDVIILLLLLAQGGTSHTLHEIFNVKFLCYSKWYVRSFIKIITNTKKTPFLNV